MRKKSLWNEGINSGRAVICLSLDFNIKMHKKGIYERFIKRPQDVVLASVAMVLLSPVMGVTALAVRKKLGSPVIFKQRRPGKDGKIFNLYKFRTMTDERDKEGNLLPDEVRLTDFGKWLRSTSLDELPELFNIIKGDMAVVGPRPLLERYLPYYTEKEMRRHDVRPGLTGLAQISGRNFLKWEERFELDLEYVNSISFSKDIRIIFDTIYKTIKKENVSEYGNKALDDLDVERKNKDGNR